ncbi:hypothetical protein BJF85_07825 [Saccharomonospora sp. CUA-673]|uniref:hypothetical protein n=1 Tax=Saccharomonospora sp. CUA-673 TaxID=1904969 RepID=UPI00096704A5|nr:hypothetical protein [Saccharomonospora sp. CUA-673]OLT39101.1 hypothetical protein BJF85_07825 [Saccharomonospora sp. CUA-673]
MTEPQTTARGPASAPDLPGSNAPALPAREFGEGAAWRLAPVAEDLRQVRDQVERGELWFDPDTAHELLGELLELQGQVHKLIAHAGENIDRPLRFGDNFVGETLAQRLKGAVDGGDNAALPVLTAYSEQIEQLIGIIRTASGLITTTDDDARDTLHGIGGVVEHGGEQGRLS